MKKDARPPDERGAFSTLGAIVALALCVAAVGSGVMSFASTSATSSQMALHSRERADVDAVETLLRRDAQTANAIYFPSSCGAAGPCPEVRFAARNPDGAWRYWGYVAEADKADVVRCAYGGSEDGPCASGGATPVVMTSAVAFDALARNASEVAAAMPSLDGHPVADVAKDLGTGDPRVTASNRVVVVQIANGTTADEVHLLPSGQASRVNYVHGNYAAPVRQIMVLPAVLAPFAYPAAPAQGGNVVEDRYGPNATFSANAGQQVATAAQIPCKANDGTVIAFANVASVGNNPGWPGSSGQTLDAVLSVVPNPADPIPGLATCTIDFHADSSNPGDVVDALMQIDVQGWGPVSANPSPLTVVVGGGSSASETSQISQGYYNGPYAVSGCSGIVSTSMNGSTLSVAAVAPGSCILTVTGAAGITTTVPVNSYALASYHTTATGYAPQAYAGSTDPFTATSTLVNSSNVRPGTPASVPVQIAVSGAGCAIGGSYYVSDASTGVCVVTAHGDVTGVLGATSDAASFAVDFISPGTPQPTPQPTGTPTPTPTSVPTPAPPSATPTPAPTQAPYLTCVDGSGQTVPATYGNFYTVPNPANGNRCTMVVLYAHNPTPGLIHFSYNEPAPGAADVSQSAVTDWYVDACRVASLNHIVGPPSDQGANGPCKFYYQSGTTSLLVNWAIMSSFAGQPTQGEAALFAANQAAGGSGYGFNDQMMVTPDDPEAQAYIALLGSNASSWTNACRGTDFNTQPVYGYGLVPGNGATYDMFPADGTPTRFIQFASPQGSPGCTGF